jgi:hypothetical protein
MCAVYTRILSPVHYKRLQRSRAIGRRRRRRRRLHLRVNLYIYIYYIYVCVQLHIGKTTIVERV